jgi:hypothetical protein
LESAGLDHQPCARDIFLGGLKNQNHRARQILPDGGEGFRERNAYGGVYVVPANMANAGVLGIKIDWIGRVRWHRVHVSAERDGGAGAPALQDSHHAMTANVATHVKPKPFGAFRDTRGGANFLAGYFRVAMQVAPEPNQVIVQHL